MLKIAVCDNEPKFVNILETILLQTFKNLGQTVEVTAFNDGQMLIKDVESRGSIYDIIFLDVEMPEINGFETARSLRSLHEDFILIFITNWDNFAREGYKYDAFRYISKNDLEAEVSEAVSAIVLSNSIRDKDDELISLKHRTAGLLDVVEVKKCDIIYLRLEKNRRVILKTISSEYALLTKPLSEYHKLLDSSSFCPIVRSHLLNFNRVAGIDGDFFILDDGEKIPLGFSRDTRKASKAKYMRFLRGRL